MEIFDKEKEIGYVVNIEPIKHDKKWRVSKNLSEKGNSYGIL